MSYTNGLDKPSDYFNTKLYSGTGSTQSITGVGFQPDWSWIKSRSATGDHSIFDSVRGTGKQLQSNTSGAEFTTADALSAFNSDGFSITGTGNNYTNVNSKTYASWNWKAGTSVSGNTTGSGTAKAYTGSVSTTAGFSIIAYTGNGTAGHTIPHHLSAVPNIVLTKGRSGALNWFFFDSMSSYLKRLKLNTTDTQADTDGLNDTAPTSSVFTVSGGGEGNTNGTTYVAYLFAEKQGYSKFGSYTGNGNADGTFVYTGFKPAWVLIKRTDGANQWIITDNKRDIDNPITDGLYADSSNSTNNGTRYDFLSNGLKMRSTYQESNQGNYIYMAFAENPFTTSSGVPATAR